MVALVGLGALAALFTAPFADPQATAGDIRSAALPAAMAMENKDNAAAAAQPQVPAASLPRNPPPAPKSVEPPAGGDLETEALQADDPRWAKTATQAETIKPGLNAEAAIVLAPADAAAPPVNLGGDGAAPMISPEAAASDEPATSVEPAAPMDDTQTAAIPPEEPVVEVARPQTKKAPAAGPAASGAAPSSTVAVTSAVKMRARAANGATVVAVIPDNAAVGLVDCEIWCEVVYKGRRGFIFKSFIGKSGSVSGQAEPKAAANEPQKPKIEKPTRVDLNSIGR